MSSTRVAVFSFLALVGLVIGPGSGTASADAELKLAGFADVPGSGGTLSLPLPGGTSPVIINLTFGIPSVTIPVEITHATHIGSDVDLPAALTDGDRITVEAVVVQGVVRASRLQIDEFPELELAGTAKGLPAAGVTVPLASGATADFIVTLGASGVDVPVRLTAHTKVKGAPFTIFDGNKVQVEAGIQNNAIIATEIRR